MQSTKTKSKMINPTERSVEMREPKDYNETRFKHSIISANQSIERYAKAKETLDQYFMLLISGVQLAIIFASYRCS
ncbi:MAG TPA: hypothetical protein DIW47_08870 [Bacteroidetes bacterium]|nr:hypothetical protein [Bacteroidota bacterium]